MRIHYQKIDGGPHRFAYRKMGNGPKPVILLHGFGNNSQMWIPFLLAHLQDATFYMPDFPGFGLSKSVYVMNADVLTVYSQLVASLIRENNLKDVFLVGFSMGSYTALKMASDGNFKNIGSYLHIDHPPLSRDGDGWKGGIDESLMQTIDGLCRTVQKVGASESLLNCDLRELPADIRANYIEVSNDLGEKSFTSGFTKTLNSLLHGMPIVRDVVAGRAAWPWGYRILNHYAAGTYDLRNAVRMIDVPVTLVRGKFSQIFNEEACAFMNAAIPKCETIIFEKSGHDLMLHEMMKFRRVFDTFLSGKTT
jgi:pimeloyl-ACP methyl ester carboxylesterase